MRLIVSLLFKNYNFFIKKSLSDALADDFFPQKFIARKFLNANIFPDLRYYDTMASL